MNRDLDDASQGLVGESKVRGLFRDYGSLCAGVRIPDYYSDRVLDSVPERLDYLIDEYGLDGNIDNVSNSRVFIDEERDSVWKIIPTYSSDQYFSDCNVYSEAGIETPTEMAVDADMRDRSLGVPLVVRQSLVDDYRSILDMPVEEVANDLASKAIRISRENQSLDFDITNFGLNDDREIIYLDDADRYSLVEDNSLSYMIGQFRNSLEKVEGSHPELIEAFKDISRGL